MVQALGDVRPGSRADWDELNRRLDEAEATATALMRDHDELMISYPDEWVCYYRQRLQAHAPTQEALLALMSTLDIPAEDAFVELMSTDSATGH